MEVPGSDSERAEKRAGLGRGKGRKSHPGVQLRPPRNERSPRWAARYRDPETGKMMDVRLLPDDAKNADTRLAFAVKLSKQIRHRGDEIRGGASAHKDADLDLTEAVKLYFGQTSVRERTVEGYREARDVFLSWCEQQSLRTCRHLNRGWLVKFKSHVKAPKLDRNGDEEERSAHTINSVLTRTGIILNWLIDAEILRLSRDDVRVALKKVPIDVVTRRDFLQPDQIRALLDAAKRHDAITYKADRRGIAAPRYAPIHDYIRFMLLTGLRPGETLALTWDRCDLVTPHLHVHPTQSKRRIDRTVQLDVCPSVVPMLHHMRQAGTKLRERVWAIHTKGSVDSTLDRLRADPLCPAFDYQLLRVTAATFLASMPSYGPVQESRQLGHSIVTAEKYYVGRVRVAPDAKTLEQAYGIVA
jgi:hypothetical protein